MTYVCHDVTFLRPKTMNEYKKEKATEKKARIFEIIKEVGKPIKSTEVFSLSRGDTPSRVEARI